MWSDLGPLGLGIVVLLFLIKSYFVGQSLEKTEKRRRETPYKYAGMGPRDRKENKEEKK